MDIWIKLERAENPIELQQSERNPTESTDHLPTLKRMTCNPLLHEYQQSIQEMVLRPKTQEEIDAAGGVRPGLTLRRLLPCRMF